ncbi:Chemotaxis protein CheY [bacterium HR33]|nr:Chemotaxis protein CheY [bacterium HR33]
MARILVIDDDPDVRRALRKILEAEGHQVLEAENGKEGIRLFRESPCDAVITDLYMPEKEGLETIRELRKSYPDSKILAITGAVPGSRFDLRQQATMLGAKRALSKPFSREEVLEALAEVLGAAP